MKQEVYAVFDSMVKSYARPFFMRTKGEALRSWVDVVNDKSSQINQHPEDYTLFHLGSYNEKTGVFENLTTPHPVGKAIEFLKPENDFASKITDAIKSSDAMLNRMEK